VLVLTFRLWLFSFFAPHSTVEGIKKNGEIMKNIPITKADLANFTGTENWYRHPLAKSILYTDGIQFLAQKAHAYWLLDEIAYSQKLTRISHQEFQCWTLNVNKTDNTAVLKCDNGNGDIVFIKHIDYTDFPLEEIRIYCTNCVVLLPSEY
jgi:hypothetical protein